MKKVLLALAMVATSVALSGCIVAPYGYYPHGRPGYYYYHPYRY